MKSLLIILVFGIGCSSKTAKVEAPSSVDSGKLVTVGLKELSDGDFDGALKNFETVLKKDSMSPYVPVATYNSGIALQGQKKFSEALERFRNALSYYSGKPSPQQADIFYHMAACYEALGDDPKTVAALLDVKNRFQFFPEEIHVEVLARLAGVYARLNNEVDAQKNYDLAEKALASLRKNILPRDNPPWMSKTLFNMGKMPLKKLVVEDFETGLKPLERGQVWLLRAARLNDPKWSQMASFELIQVYRDAWSLTEAVPIPKDEDKLVGMKSQQEKMMSMAAALFGMMSRLKLERGVDFDHENKYVREVFDYLDGLEKNLETLLKSRPVEESLTPEAEKTDGLKRGTTITPTPQPEKKLPAKKPDPNL